MSMRIRRIEEVGWFEAKSDRKRTEEPRAKEISNIKSQVVAVFRGLLEIFLYFFFLFFCISSLVSWFFGSWFFRISLFHFTLLSKNTI